MKDKSVLVLPHNDRIIFQVAHVNKFSLCFNVWMFSAQKPAHVSEKETSLDIVWICICLREFVMSSMISHPHVYRILNQKNHQILKIVTIYIVYRQL